MHSTLLRRIITRSQATLPFRNFSQVISIHVKGKYVDKTVEAHVGQHLLDVCRVGGIVDVQGACDASLACSTCHIIMEEPKFKELKMDPSEDEIDILDLAPCVTDWSRLACQVKVSKEMDGMTIRIPEEYTNQLLL